jgi:choline kinase
MRVIILSAGQGRRLLPATAERPKCLLPVRGDESILEVQLRTLAACGIEHASVVVGHGAAAVQEQLAARPVEGLEVDTVYNPFYGCTDNLVSCWLVRDRMVGPFLLLNGDTLFAPAVLERLLEAPEAPLTLAVNQKESYDADDMKVSLGSNGSLRRVGKGLDPSRVDGESIGLMRFDADGAERFCCVLDGAVRSPRGLRQWYLSAVDALAASTPVATVSITGHWWCEIDSPADLAAARADLAVGAPRCEPASRAVRAASAPRMRIGLLNNLRAGRSDAKVSRILRLLEDHPEVAHVETSSAGAVPDALAELADRNVDLLVVNGGDGTLQHALTEILGQRPFGDRVPMIAPLRGGRTNMTALDIGATRDPVRSVARLLDAAREQRLEDCIVERAVLRVEYGPHREARYGMFFGAGLIHRAIELVHRVFPQGRSQGVFGATVVTGALLGKRAMARDAGGILEPDKLQILLDDVALPQGEFTLAIASPLQRLFARMRPFWGEGPGAVRFTAIEAGARSLWRAAPGILAGRPGPAASEANGYTSRNTRCARMRLDCGFTVDGELIAPEPGRVVSITAADRIRFVRA